MSNNPTDDGNEIVSKKGEASIPKSEESEMARTIPLKKEDEKKTRPYGTVKSDHR